MMKSIYRPEFKLKLSFLVAGLCLVVDLSAVAQTPSFSLPPLPSVPQAPSVDVPASPVAGNVPADVTPQATLPSLPSPTAGIALPPIPGVKVAEAPGSAAPPISVLPPPPAPDAQAAAGVENAALANADTAALPAALPLPGDDLSKTGEINPAGGLAGGLPAALPPIGGEMAAIEPKKKELKSWQTSLAPSIIPPKTNFNYRRQILPETIYRADYSKGNRHLPHRLTRDDYANQLFNSVARNDVEATRAMLNTGMHIETKTQAGKTPLALAVQHGSMDVAALLTARGARQ